MVVRMNINHSCKSVHSVYTPSPFLCLSRGTREVHGDSLSRIETIFVSNFVAKYSNDRPTEMLIQEHVQMIGHTFVNTVDSSSNSLAILKCYTLRRHTDRAELPHACSKCSQKFATKWDLEEHFRANHLKGPQKCQYECPKCELGFTQSPHSS